jgi:integrase/recombinase XerD
VRFRDLTVHLLLSYAETLQKDLSLNSQALALASVKSILSFGFKVGYLEKNLGAFLKIPKQTDQRVRKVLDESKIHEMIFSEPKIRNRLILRLLYSGGLRVSELCALKWRDLQERGDSCQLIVRGKGDKQRIVLLSQGTWEKIKSYRNGAIDLVISGSNGLNEF